MDPASAVIGLTAALVQLIGTTIKALEYVSDVKDGKDERTQLASQLRLLRDLLPKLEDKARSSSPGSSSLAWLVETEGPLEQMKISMAAIVKQLHTGTGPGKVVSIATWPYRRRQITRFLDQVEALKSTITLALTEDNLSQTAEVQNHVKNIREITMWLKEDVSHVTAILRLTKSISADTKLIRAMNIDNVRQAAIDKRLIIAEWISSTNSSAAQNSIIRNAGTGGWFLESPTFQDFRKTSQSTLLCVGRPGAGKSMTAAVTVQYLWQRLQASKSSGDSFGVACIFFNYRTQDSQSHYDMLAVLIKQLLLDLDEVPPAIVLLHDLLAKRDAKASLEDLRTCMRQLVAANGISYIILDALDECEFEARSQLLEDLFLIKQDADVRLLATSREVPEVLDLFDSETLRTTIRANDDDVRTYTEPKLKALGRFILKDEDLRQSIIDTVINAADGMFLLAQLHLEALKGKATKRDVKQALLTLPRGRDAITQAYKDNLERIDNQSAERRDLAHMAIAMTKLASPLLQVAQLREALSLRVGDDRIDEDGLPEVELILDVCRGLLVTGVRADGIPALRFVHYTTEEFFDHHLESWVSQPRKRFQSICLAYLNFDRESAAKPSSEIASKADDNKYHPVLEEYMCNHWAKQFEPIESLDNEIKEKLIDLLADKKCAHLATIHGLERWPESRFFSREGYSGVHLAALNGLHAIFPYLTEKGLPFDSKDEEGRTPLSFAAQAASLSTVKSTLQIESAPNGFWDPDRRGMHVLDYAWKQKDRAVFDFLRASDRVRLALEQIENPKLRDVIMTGDVNATRSLLERQTIDPNEANGRGHTALHEAIRHSVHDGTTLVQVLVESQRLDVNAKNQKGKSALHKAVKKKGTLSEELIQLLLNRGDIIVNSTDRLNNTPLHIAASSGTPLALATILKHPSTDPHLTNSMGKMPIYRAILATKLANVELLLNHPRADINVVHGRGETPLITALYYGALDIAVFIAGRPGVNVNVLDAWAKTPLMRAAEKGLSDVVVVLVQNPDTDLLRQDKDGRDARWHAENRGFLAIRDRIQAAIEKRESENETTTNKSSNTQVDSPEPTLMTSIPTQEKAEIP